MSLKVSGVKIGDLTGQVNAGLEDLNNVSIVNPVDGDYLRYNSGILGWQNSQIDADVFSYFITNVTSSNGVVLTPATGVNTIDIGLNITASGDASGVLANGNLSLALATVNSAPQNDGLRKITVNGKGLVTATTAITTGDLTPLLDATYVNVTGDTMTGPLTAPSFIGAMTGNASSATILETARTISATGDAAWAVTFNGSSNVNGTLVLTNVNAAPQSDTFRKITVNTKGLVTATSAVTPLDITTALAYTPVNKAGDTMTGLLILSANPTSSFGAATKQYVDNIAAGLTAKFSCLTATTATLASSSGGTVTYNNGASGVGATLTTSTSFSTIGGASIVNGDRILVKNETDAIGNGIYVKTSNTVLTRATDFDDSPDGEIETGSFTYIQSGTLVGTNWVLTTQLPIVIGGSEIFFTQLSGPGTNTGGPGIDVDGNVINNTGVLSNIAGAGISVSSATGDVTISNTGVLSVTGTANQIVTTAATGAITLSLPSSVTIGGTMTAGSFTGAGTGLTGTAASLNIGGNAATATKLQTARTINGVSFDGTANIVISASTTAGLTMNTGGAGAASGTIFNGGAAQTISYNTIGAPSTTGANASGTWAISITGNSVTVGGFTPSQAPGVASRVVVADASGYINNSYYNGTDAGTNGAAGAVSGILAKWGDDYYRTTNAQSIANYLSGTSMNISGTASNANTLAGNSETVYVRARGAIAVGNADAARNPGFYAVDRGGFSDFMMDFSDVGNSAPRVQINAAYGDELYFRVARDAVTQWDGLAYPGHNILSSANYNNYAPTKTGGGASGTWPINISGNSAGTFNTIQSGAPNADWNAYFNGTTPSQQRWGETSSGGPSGNWWMVNNWRHSNASNSWGVQHAYGWESSGNEIYSRTVSSGSFSGWVRYLNSANYNSYAPTLTGGNASGTWGINITGNAASANTANSATTAGSANTANFATTAGSANSATTAGSANTANSATTADSVTSSPNRTDGTAYPVVWNTTGGTSQNYTCAAVTITSSNGTLSATNLSASSSIYSGGDVTAFSDESVKCNIEVIPDALDKVGKIRGVLFDRNDRTDGVRHSGVIAQEVQKVLPEVVREGENGLLGVNYGNMVGLLIEAVKELNAKVETLQAKLDALGA